MSVDCAWRVVVGEELLRRYLEPRWVRHLERFGARRGREDAAGGELTADMGVVVPVGPWSREENLELAGALAGAANEWQAAEALADARRRGSIVVAVEDAGLAVAEIERRAGDRRFVQVVVPGLGHAPMGDRRYWPIYGAAERHGLPVCGLAEMERNVASLVFNGVLERFPGLRVLSGEGGVEWLPPLVWRMDGSWKVLKDEVPELRRLPSEYVGERCWFVVGEDAEVLGRVVEWLGYDDRVVYGGGGPTEGLSARVMGENARGLYAGRL